MKSLQASIAPSPLPPLKGRSTLRVLPLSDLHLTAHPPATQLLLQNQEYLQQMDYVVLLGDQCGCYGTDREYQALDEFLQQIARSYTAINGNHEFYFEVHDEALGQYGRIWREQSTQDKACQLHKFREFFGFPALWHAQSHELGVFIFLALDDVEHHKPENLSAPQLTFLEEQLRAAQSTPLYIFCHAPLMLRHRLDMEYYNSERTACVELEGELRDLLEARTAPAFWISGHIHLHPDHHLFAPYRIAPSVWQVHCPDSWGYSRWLREHLIPQRHPGLFSRHLEIRSDELALVTYDHCRSVECGRQNILLH